VQTIAEWLASTGLSEYAERFAENYIDSSVLPDLTDQDLKDLGIPLGHRKMMLRAITELQGTRASQRQTATEPAGRHGREKITDAEWLASIGLSEYAQRFAENYVDPSVLPDLTDQDLKDLEIPFGHRKRMLRAISKLQGVPAGKAQTVAELAGRDYAERRQLTVMFCDLVGSTALSARLDPKDMRQLLALFHRRVAEVIGGYQGTVARYMGDGALAHFGYPLAHEDDAEQAVRAGLALVDDVPHLQTGGDACLCRKLNPDIIMMQSAQDGSWKDAANSLDRARERRILVER
jgi:hypothetical protein